MAEQNAAKLEASKDEQQAGESTSFSGYQSLLMQSKESLVCLHKKASIADGKAITV